MPFELNEAPDMILKAIHSARVSRGCGYFWSWLCVIPTFGMSTNCCGSCDGNCDSTCCYPKSTDLQTDSSLKTLVQVLEDSIRIKDSYFKEHPDADRLDLIEEQVVNTINVVKDKLDNEFPDSTYKEAIKYALSRIQARATSEARAKAIMDRSSQGGERAPLLAYPLENTNVRTGGYKRTEDPEASKNLNASNGRQSGRRPK